VRMHNRFDIKRKHIRLRSASLAQVARASCSRLFWHVNAYGTSFERPHCMFV
jgi:hypothetical protein